MSMDAMTRSTARRRICAGALALSLGLAGVTWSGCGGGDAEQEASELQQEAAETAEGAAEETEEQSDESQNGAPGGY